MEHLLNKLASRYGLTYNALSAQEGTSASGYLGRYPVNMIYDPGQRTLKVNFWTTCENTDEESAEEQALAIFLNNLVTVSDGMITTADWSGDNEDRFGTVSLTFHDPKGEEENTELFLANILQRTRTFLEEHRFTVKCGLCAGSENVGVYLVDGLYGVSHCRACNESWREEMKESARAVRLSLEEWLRGIWGSLFGALLGMFLWIVVHKAGYAAALCGMAVALGCVRGFEKRAKKQNSATICVQILIFISACILVETHCLVMDVHEAWSGEYPGITYHQVAAVIPDLLYESQTAREQFFGNLFFGLFLGGLASYGLFRNIWNRSRQGVTCVELIPPENKNA